MTERPMPPEGLATPLEADAGGGFRPAPEVEIWIRDQILAEDGALYNEAHDHLEDAALGCLWTNVPAIRKQRAILATAEQPTAGGDPWTVARRDERFLEWFGLVPDFLLTLYAPYCTEATDRAFAALVEHELYHCAQALNAYGMPRFDRQTGLPRFEIRGHDVEEFVGVVRRYGAVNPGVQELVDAGSAEPEIGEAAIAQACGICLAKR